MNKLPELEVLKLAAMACGIGIDDAENYQGDIDDLLEEKFGIDFEVFFKCCKRTCTVCKCGNFRWICQR